MNPSRTTVDRTLLALTGAALPAGGGWLVLTAVAERLPGWWPGPGSGTVLLDRAGLADSRGRGWCTPAVVAGPASAPLLCLTWFPALHPPGTHVRVGVRSRRERCTR
ncbi:hypothetical protein ACIQ6R_33615 [Streptomyces sp. NPDC096048]|uniref:hypothetical protein n=1 Tax=Streptomyces sp. NPDC096048 TaxID=3366072 RepID=UPI0037F34C8C